MKNHGDRRGKNNFDLMFANLSGESPVADGALERSFFRVTSVVYFEGRVARERLQTYRTSRVSTGDRSRTCCRPQKRAPVTH